MASGPLSSVQGVISPASTVSAITQLTSTTTAVTLNQKSGVISCYTSTAAAGAEAAFTFNNSHLAASGGIILSMLYPAANTGAPIVYADAIASGTCQIIVKNTDSAVALNGVVKIAFLVL